MSLSEECCINTGPILNDFGAVGVGILLSVSCTPPFTWLHLFTEEAHITRDGVISTRNSHLWAHDNPRGTMESNFHISFSVKVWRGAVLTAASGRWYLSRTFAKVTADPLMERSSAARLEIAGGPPPNFSRNVTRCLDEQFRGQWIGPDSELNWPLRWPGFCSLGYHVWSRIKVMVHEHKTDRRNEWLQRIFNAGRQQFFVTLHIS
jgi:hypothetical protein